MEKKREYKQCLRCGKTIDTTDNDNEVCTKCFLEDNKKLIKKRSSK